MAVIRLNSFWDYLGQGVQNFGESLGEKQRRELLEKQEKRAETMFGYQAAPYEMASQIISDPTPEAAFIPNLITGAGGGVTVPLPGKFSENQYALARAAVPSLESPTQRIRRTRREQIEDKLKDLQVPVAELGAAKATSQIAGVPSDIQRSRVAELQPIVTDFAKAYVAKQIIASNGRLTGTNLPALAARAYGEFTADPTRAESLGIAGVSSDTLRPLFDEAVKAAWDEQRKLDIDSLRAQAYMQGQGPADKTPQLMNALTNVGKIFENRVKALNESLDPGRFAAMDPKTAKSPIALAFLEKVQREQGIVNQIMAASTGLAAGTVAPEQVQLLLNDVSKLIQGEGVVTPGTTTPQTFDDAAIVAEAQKYGPSRWRAWLNEGVRQGKIDQVQAQRVLSLLERRKPGE